MNNQYCYAAAALLVVLACLHSFWGEKYILIRLFRRELPKLFGSEIFVKQTLRMAWHLTSLFWFSLALLLIALGSAEQQFGRPELIQLIGWTFAAGAVMSVIMVRGKHFSWLVFSLISWLMLSQ